MTWRQTHGCSHSKEDVTSPSSAVTPIKCTASPCRPMVGFWPLVAWTTKSAFGTLKITNYWILSQDTETLLRCVTAYYFQIRQYRWHIFLGLIVPIWLSPTFLSLKRQNSEGVELRWYGVHWHTLRPSITDHGRWQFDAWTMCHVVFGQDCACLEGRRGDTNGLQSWGWPRHTVSSQRRVLCQRWWWRVSRGTETCHRIIQF